MKLPTFKRLNIADYDDQYKGLIGTLSFALNNAIEGILNALNRNVSLSDNIACSVRDVTVTVDSKGTPKNTTSMSLETTSAVIGCQVIKATNSTNSAIYPTGGIFITFTQTNNGLTFNNITGLPADNNFTLKVVAYI